MVTASEDACAPVYICSELSLLIIPGANSDRAMRLRAVIKLVNLFFDFRRKTDAMQFIAALQTAHRVTHLTDLANLGMRITVFDVDACARLSAFRSVVVVIGHVSGMIFDEIIFRR